MNDPTSAFAKMVPGFDFLQGLVKNAGAALPGVGQWIAPTLDPAELEKRISELRTVQYWLEQNARLLGVSIQALEVQRMTLSTLKTMNVSMADLTESLKIRMPADQPPPAPPSAPKPFFAAPAPAPAAAAPAEPAAPASPPGVIDPMQWWGALTQQFSELASKALQDSNTDVTRNLAGSMVKQGLEAASETLKSAAAMPMSVAQNAAEAARKMAAGSTGQATPQAAPPATPPAATRKPAAKRSGAAAKRSPPRTAG